MPKDLFLFRLNKLASITGQPLIRLCEGRYGITRREWRLIVTLSREGALLSSQLAEQARIEPARTSRAVTLLAEKGLVTRVPRAHDRRYVDIQLTDRGRGIFESLYPAVVEMNTKLLSGLAEAEQANLDRLFAALEHRASSLMQEPGLPKADRQRKGR
jgi:DNA-binding MarR family transcriptional regulator